MTLNLTISEDADSELGKTLSTNGLVNATPITVTLSPVAGGTAVTCTGTTVPTYSPSTSIAATATCSLPSLAVNVWEIDATIGGNWYTGTGVGVLTVMDPSLGFTTGGGWFNYADPNGVTANNAKVNFGFNAKILKSGQVQGSVLTIFKRSNGNYIVKSNSMGGLAIAQIGTSTPAHYSATIAGKATYGVPVTDPILTTCSPAAWKCGGYTFLVYVEDNAEPGAGADKYWIQVKDPSGVVVAKATINPAATGASPGPTNAQLIVGGNIQVPQPQGGK
jgi:hypothetical protein